FLRQLLRHLISGRQCHKRVIAVVIVSAEGAGVGQGGGSDNRAQIGARFQFFHDERQQFVGRRLFQQRHQRLAAAEDQPILGIGGQGRGQPQIGRQGGA